MKRAQPKPSSRSAAMVWLFLAAAVFAGLGAALDFAAPHAGAGPLDRAGAASALGLVAAVVAALVARALRLVLGRREREGEGDAGDRA